MTDGDKPLFVDALVWLAVALREPAPDALMIRIFWQALHDCEIRIPRRGRRAVDRRRKVVSESVGVARGGREGRGRPTRRDEGAAAQAPGAALPGVR